MEFKYIKSGESSAYVFDMNPTDDLEIDLFLALDAAKNNPELDVTDESTRDKFINMVFENHKNLTTQKLGELAKKPRIRVSFDVKKVTPELKSNIAHTISTYIPAYLDDLDNPSMLFTRIKLAGKKGEEHDVLRPAWPFKDKEEIKESILNLFRDKTQKKKRKKLQRSKSQFNASNAFIISISGRIDTDLSKLRTSDKVKLYLHQLQVTFDTFDEDENIKAIKDELDHLVKKCWAWQTQGPKHDFHKKHENALSEVLPWSKEIGLNKKPIQRSTRSGSLGLDFGSPSKFGIFGTNDNSDEESESPTHTTSTKTGPKT